MDSLWLFCISTIFCLLNAFRDVIIKQVLAYTHTESSQSRDLRKEMMAIKQEMSQFSMMDEFARHARLQRKLIKLQQEWKNEASTVSSLKMQYKIISTISAHLVLALLILILMYQYYYEPVLELPEQWIYPISFLLSWPSSAGVVGLTSWLLISGTCFNHLANLVI